MVKHTSDREKKRQSGMKPIAVVAFCCVLVGFLLAAGFDGKGTAAAQTTVSTGQSGLEGGAISSPFSALVERLTPSVVNVKVSKVEKAGFPLPDAPGDPFYEFFNHPRLPRNRPVQGAGSGVIISSDGYILTNNHVVEGAREVEITFDDKGTFKAEIVGRDPKTDLAVLKIDAGKNLPSASMGDSNQLKVGDWVMAIGNPFGLSHTVTSGIVSGKGRVIGAGPYDDFIQTDASINPGNSGGPLFNMQGEVVGINTAIIPNGQGIGFAIPINTAKPLIPQLVEKGQVTRGYLGVQIQSITPELAAALNIEKAKGALVTEVVSGGPADKAGIKQGDVIVSYDGKAVQDNHDLPAMVAGTAVGKEVAITALRDGKEVRLTIEVAELDSDEPAGERSKEAPQGKWGMQLQDLTPQVALQLGIKADRGVAVVGVQPGSPADQASIRTGDVILEVNRQPVTGVKDVKEKISRARRGDSLLLLVRGQNGSRYVVLKG